MLEAIAQFEQALALQPDDTKVLFALGNTASQLGLAGPAEQFFRQVLALEPGRLEAIVNLANLLRGAGQYDAAIALLEPALAREPAKPRTAPDPGFGLAGKRRFRTGADCIITPPWRPVPTMPLPWPIWPTCSAMPATAQAPEHCTTRPSRPTPATPRPG